MFPCKKYIYISGYQIGMSFLLFYFACVCKTIWVRKLSALINWWRRRRQSVVWGKSHWVWGQIHRVASCTLDHEAAQECRWLTGSKQEKQRSAHHRFKARWVPRDVCVMIACNTSFLLLKEGGILKKRMFNLLSVQVAMTFSVGEEILSFCGKKRQFSNDSKSISFSLRKQVIFVYANMVLPCSQNDIALLIKDITQNLVLWQYWRTWRLYPQRNDSA